MLEKTSEISVKEICKRSSNWWHPYCL